MVVHSVAVRKAPNPHGSVVKVMKAFRPDFRPQEMFAVRKATGTDGEVWYRVSIPMRPNGTYGWIPADTVSAAVTVTPTRSRALRERGLLRCSTASGSIAFGVTSRSEKSGLGRGSGHSGRSRNSRLRSRKKFFTIRSSSE